MNYPKSKLGDVATIVTGSTPSKSNESYWNGNIPFVTPSELDADKDVISAAVYVTDKGASVSRLIPKNSIMVCCIGSLGKVGVSGCDLLTNQQINTLIFDPKKVYFRYGYHFCKTLKPYLEHIAPSTTVAIVNKSRFSEIEIPLPPLEEQKRIAAILDKADSLRRKRAQAITLADDFLRATFLDMFGDPVTNPKGWLVYELRDLVEIGDKINYGVVQPGDNAFDDGVPLVRSGDLHGETPDIASLRYISLSIDQKHRKSKLKGNEILIACVGTIGKVGFVTDEMIGWNIARAVARIPIKSGVNREYVYRYLQSPVVQGYFKKETRTVAQPTLNVSLIETTPITLPPEGLQLDYLKIHTKVQSFLSFLNKQIEELEQLADSLSINMVAS